MIKNHGSPAGRQPFSSVWQAATMLDCSERRVYQYIQSGDISMAFDISRRGGGRVCLRLSTASVVAMQRNIPRPMDLGMFLAAAAPETQFSYKAPQLARLFQCDTDHIYRLVEAEVLEDAGGTTRYRVPRHSVIRFLTERQVK